MKKYILSALLGFNIATNFIEINASYAANQHQAMATTLVCKIINWGPTKIGATGAAACGLYAFVRHINIHNNHDRTLRLREFKHIILDLKEAYESAHPRLAPPASQTGFGSPTPMQFGGPSREEKQRVEIVSNNDQQKSLNEIPVTFNTLKKKYPDFFTSDQVRSIRQKIDDNIAKVTTYSMSYPNIGWTYDTEVYDWAHELELESMRQEEQYRIESQRIVYLGAAATLLASLTSGYLSLIKQRVH